MNQQDLYSLADAEIRMGMVDRGTMDRAEHEAAGKSYLVHENYWRLRAISLAAEANAVSASDPDAYLIQIRENLAKGRRKANRSTSIRAWIWTCACFGFAAAGVVAIFFAKGAFKRGSPATVGYATLGIVGGVLSAVCVARVRALENREF
jgi:hypothetical protein